MDAKELKKRTKEFQPGQSRSPAPVRSGTGGRRAFPPKDLSDKLAGTGTCSSWLLVIIERIEYRTTIVILGFRSIFEVAHK